MKIRPGEFDTPFEVQARTDVPDGLGGVTTTWATLGIAWAKFRDVKGEEKAMAASTVAYRTHYAIIYPFPDLTEAHRLKIDGRTFDIKCIKKSEKIVWSLDLLEIVGREAQ